MAIHERKISARLKPDGSPFSEADEAAEAILLPALAKAAPDISVVSEENVASHKLDVAPLFFLIDPIDGTKELLKPGGQGSFTVNIGLIQNGVPFVGLVYFPAFDAPYIGVAGHQALKITNGFMQPLSVREVPAAGGMVMTTDYKPCSYGKKEYRNTAFIETGAGRA